MFHFINYVGIYDRQNISFHSSYWNPRKTNNVSFKAHISIYARQTDKLHFTSLILIQTRLIIFFIPDIGIDARQTNCFISFHSLCWHFWQTKYVSFHTSKDRRTTYVSIHPSYLNPRKTDRRIKYDSFHSLCWDPSKTYILRLICLFILGSKENRRTNYVTFHPLYWNPC